MCQETDGAGQVLAVRRYDPASNRTAVTETLRLPDATLAETVGQFGYDDLGRLLTAGYSDGSAFSYGYDAVGNRLAATRTLTSTQTHSYTYDDANRLVTADGVPYSWDDAGNLLSDGVYTYSLRPRAAAGGDDGGGTGLECGLL